MAQARRRKRPKGEALLIVETDKVTVEIECPAEGILSKTRARPGDVVPVTTEIAILLTGDETPEDLKKPWRCLKRDGR